MILTASAAPLRAVRVLIQPGWRNSGPEHWQSLWERRLGARSVRVSQRDWLEPECGEWVETLRRFCRAEDGPILLLAHSVGCLAVVHLLGLETQELPAKIAAAVLVAPADVEREEANPALRSFAPIPMTPLTAPSLLVASTDDPYCSRERAQAFAQAWRADLHWLHGAQHINSEGGFGPWPEGWDLVEQWLKKNGLAWNDGGGVA